MSASASNKLKQILGVQQQEQKKLSLSSSSSSLQNNNNNQQKPIDENRLLLSKVQKWNSATTLKFLKLYHKYPCLWDMNHKHYKDRYIRQVALDKMADYMNLPNFDSRYVALKIRVLRTTYMEERRKIQRRSIETGQLTTQLDWFKFADSFLKNNIVRFRKSKIDTTVKNLSLTKNKNNNNNNNDDNLKNDQLLINDNNNYGQISVKNEFNDNNINDDNHINEIETAVSPDLLYYTNNNNNNNNNDDEQQHQSNEFNNINDDGGESELNYLNHNNNNNENDNYNNINNSVEKRRISFNDIIYPTTTLKKSKFDDNQKLESNDEFDCFGKSISAQLKSLPLDRAYELELKIQYLLTNAKLESFGKNASNVLNMNFF